MRGPMHARRAAAILEILMAISIFALGVLPLYDIFAGARRGIGDSREMLLLQSQAMQLMSEGRAAVSAGRLRELDSSTEDIREVERNGVMVKLRISRIAGSQLLMLFSRATKDDRYYECYQVVSDPFTSFEVGEAAP